MKNRLTIKERLKSIGHALDGIVAFFRSEPNAVIHLAATAAVIILAIVFPVTNGEAIALTLAVGFVWVAELFNTAIEKMMDFVSKERLPQIKLIKDVAAAAVLLAAITALVTGCFVFIPKW